GGAPARASRRLRGHGVVEGGGHGSVLSVLGPAERAERVRSDVAAGGRERPRAAGRGRETGVADNGYEPGSTVNGRGDRGAIMQRSVHRNGTSVRITPPALLAVYH